MITLTLKNNLNITLCLKSSKEERLFYYKWYSMSDIPRYMHEILTFTTEQDLPVKYKVSDIIKFKCNKIKDLKKLANSFHG